MVKEGSFINWSMVVYLIVFLGVPAAWCNEYCEDAQSLSQEVEKLRGLYFKNKVKCVVLDEKNFKQALDDTRKDAQEKKNAREWEREAYRLLGFLEKESNKSCIEENFVENYEAFYDYGLKKRIVLPSWKQTSKQILVHELTHALQDQHFNLSKLDKKICTSTDSCIALAALTEGDAVLIDEEYGRSSKEPSEPKKQLETGQVDQCKVPEALALQGSFAYGFGKLFVKRQKDTGGNEALNKAFMNPPRSTREILHKNDYSAEKGALFGTQIFEANTGTSGAKRRLLYEDTLGQYTIRLILRRIGNQEKAILAAKGWNGDRLELFKEEGDLVLLWKTSWNTRDDAKEFSDSLKKLYSDELKIQINYAADYFNVEMIRDLSIELRQSQTQVILRIRKFNFEPANVS